MPRDDDDDNGDAYDDSRVRTMASTLLRWCCGIILHLVTLDVEGGGEEGTQEQSSKTMEEAGGAEMPTLHQQGLALLASII